MTASSLVPASLASDQPTTKLRLKDILKTLPKECFQKNKRKAWATALITLLMVGLGYLSLAVAPWFLLPIAWIFTGTALTGCFVVAHDCGHRSFAKRRWVNDWVGHLFMLPLIYPFHSWRIHHNYHHTHTNKMDEDNAWQPLRPEIYGDLGKLAQKAYQATRGWFWWAASIVHWAALHFDPTNFQPKDRPKIKLSVGVVLGFAAIAFPILLATTGPWGFVKFWLLPWLVFHFWMSTFTLVHHTAPEVDFQEPDEWDAVKAQLSGTIHCEYPAWIEFLCHHINVHVPHHLSTAIPSYNLRMAHRSLQQNWGSYLHETRFSWSLMQRITDECHLYHAQNGYQSFREFHALEENRP
ncbi:fatty acid desaturase [Kovacikia minuta CCNUW1]|uniref:fatty acid desaturase n=1 Tax=Kovacikia minuta TaxID=2931930 RepID=UPI001CCE5643|nr:fatty acid desaturase [Kovacikia minuta]UBF25840.1 fatty acid desaturase [Kovacikia minuta CCNUW1]